jgi:ABC-type proline/glycine betaine transport system permease subunit
MADDPVGARKGGNNSLQRWQIAAAAVAGISVVALCFILPREIIRFLRGARANTPAFFSVSI